MKTLDEAYEPIVIEDEDDIGSNRSTNRPLVEIVGARLSRRAMLRGFVTTAAVGVMGGTLTSRLALGAAENGPSTLTFTQRPTCSPSIITLSSADLTSVTALAITSAWSS